MNVSRFTILAVAVTALAAVASTSIQAQHAGRKGPSMLNPEGPSLRMPMLDSRRGRKLFASRGCVLCHSVNGVGGETGPSLDAARSMPMASPFTFAAKMWRGAEAMIALQDEELGYQIDLDGEELGHITAFAHDYGEQKKFSERDIPREILRLMKARNL